MSEALTGTNEGGAPRERRMGHNPTGALTREQVEQHITERCVNQYPHINVKMELLDTDAALRATIKQQAQTIARVERERDLLQQENMNRRTTLGDLAHEMQKLKQQLAAMQTERDNLKKWMDSIQWTADANLQAEAHGKEGT